MEFLPIDFLDLVESGEAKVVLPTTDPGSVSYGDGRLMPPVETNYCTNPASVGTKWGTDATGIAFTLAASPPVSLPAGFTSCTKVVHSSSAWQGVDLVPKFSVAAGEVYTASVYAHISALASGDWLYFGFRTFNGAAEIRSMTPETHLAATNSSFVRISKTITIAGSGEDGLSVGFMFAAGTSTGYVTGCLTEKSAVPTSYFDGSSGTGCAWSGGANASTSTRTAPALEYAGYVTLSGAGVTAVGTNVAYSRNSSGTYYGPVVVTPTAKSAEWQAIAATLWSNPLALFGQCAAGDILLPLGSDSLGYRKVT